MNQNPTQIEPKRYETINGSTQINGITEENGSTQTFTTVFREVFERYTWFTIYLNRSKADSKRLHDSLPSEIQGLQLDYIW